MELFSKKERILRFIAGIIMMVVGSAGVMVLVLVMNSIVPKKHENKTEYKEMITSNKKTPPKKKKRKKTEQKKKNKTTSQNVPRPVISSAISGLSFDLPGFETTGMDDAVDKLIGEQAVNDVVMTTQSVDVIPKPLYEGNLEYPPRARQKNIEGYVLINMLIDAAGAVERVKVLESEPVGTFDTVTVAWAKSLKFSPAYYNGKAVKTWARRRIPFSLSE
ncbi:MAG: energy transducer TonB [Deltaproteobacteria bacterium]|nr:energy transducer TonB [Deltaproteobacteria bacterium]